MVLQKQWFMSPTKNSDSGINCNRTKMLFPSKEKAEWFIGFNIDEIEESVRRPTNEDSIPHSDPHDTNTQYFMDKF